MKSNASAFIGLLFNLITHMNIIIIIIMGLRSVSASKDVIGDPDDQVLFH